MKLDEKGRPICIGVSPTRRCGTPIHPGYSRCYHCDRLYTGEEYQWCKEQLAAQDARIAEGVSRRAKEDAEAKGPNL